MRKGSIVVLLLLAGLRAEAGQDLAERIRQESERAYPELVAARRWFHQHPELSNREVATAEEITRRLRALGLEVRTGVGGAGVVATLRGALPGPLVVWRSDIDALPIEEQVDVPFRSASQGIMHACGHDVHITVGLGAAQVLSTLRADLHGTVRFLFQPAEEGAPAGEEGGATAMIKEGVLADPVPTAIFGLHVWPELRAGQIGWRSGGIMASADYFRVRVTGKMSHGSEPQKSIDAVVVASQVVSALQTIASREIDPRRPVVVSVGSLHAGNRSNIIAAEAVLEGTVRTLDDETHRAVPAALERIVKGVCEAGRARCELVVESHNPVTSNDPALTAAAVPALRGSLGAEAVFESEPIMAAEDFSHYARIVPGFYFFLGIGNPEEGWTSGLHTPTFRADERAILTGVRAAATLLAGAGASWR